MMEMHYHRCTIFIVAIAGEHFYPIVSSESCICEAGTFQFPPSQQPGHQQQQHRRQQQHSFTQENRCSGPPYAIVQMTPV
ncbi:hypothetical protein AND_002716 [Anopheles darlingi]|uniref:Uncharacterized protein n=1 Tax=Anopheles darlingi TaxID=43151 RepID=W5JQE8_ANODA|nr:hypothetical protein AND_002716 [Anopheles darlingi]